MADQSQRRPESEIEEIVEAAQRRRQDGRLTFGQVLKAKMRRALVENAALKFVAFVLAITGFIVVHSYEDQFVKVNVGVSYTLPESRVLVSEPPASVQITVKGSRRKIRRFEDSDLERINVDLRRHRRSEYVFHEDLMQLPEGIELVHFTPSSFRTFFEQRVDKPVPVEVQTSGTVASGYRVSEVSVKPSTVRVTGPRRAMEVASEVRTREVSLTERRETFRETVSLVPSDDLVKVVEPSSGEVVVEVVVVEERASRRVGPLAVHLRPRRGVSPAELARFVVDPEHVEVTLHGPRLAVEEVPLAEIEAFVELSEKDIVSGKSRTARIVVSKPAAGIGLEVVPEEVTVRPRRASGPR